LTGILRHAGLPFDAASLLACSANEGVNMLVAFEPVQGSGIDCNEVVSVLRQAIPTDADRGFAFVTSNWREDDEAEGSQGNSARKCSINAEATGVDTGFGLH
jgi:hypothetical protein